jgi:3-hydroxyacyl-CoA dehydrogenase
MKIPSKFPPPSRVAVIGGGTMGSSISVALALAGSLVFLVELDEKAMENSFHRMKGFFKKKKISS